MGVPWFNKFVVRCVTPFRSVVTSAAKPDYGRKRPIRRLSPADISCDVRPKSCHTSARWSVNGYVALIADEASRSCIKDHDPKELQVAVRVSLSVRKETGRRLRVYQFRPKALDLARKNLRSLDGQKPGFCSKARRMFRPVCPRSALSQLNCIWVRKTSVDSEISIIDFLGVECGKYRERESKKKRISWAHKDCINEYASSSCQLDAIFHCSTTPGSISRQQTRFLTYAGTIAARQAAQPYTATVQPHCLQVVCAAR